MKTLLVAALLAAAALPASAQNSPQNPPQGQAPQKPLITCMYNESGKFTTAETNTAYAHPRVTVLTGRGGDKAWAYAIRAEGASNCPAHVPPQD
jgi:hypothetical protein